MSRKKQLVLSEEVLVKAEARARALGLTLAEYVEALVDQDVAAKAYDPWREPIPPAVDEQWEREIAEFDQQEKTTPRPSAKTVNEFRILLTQEAEQLPDDEGH